MTTIDAYTGIPELTVSLDGGVLTVTLNRPDSLNSLNAAMLSALADAVEHAADDPQVRAVRAITSLPKPAVAVVQGPTAGVGVSLALACDIVLASEKAFFLLAFTKIGLMPDGGASALVAASIGRARAMKMALLAERVSATEAFDIGLISTVYPADELEAGVAAVLDKLVSGPAIALRKTKQAINAATLTELDAAIGRESEGQLILLGSSDFREGTKAFQEHRSPTFTDD